MPPLVLQLVEDGCFASLGHGAELPVQKSVASQTPAAALHDVVGSAKASVGHCGEEPEHTSWMSHNPALTLQSVPEDE